MADTTTSPRKTTRTRKSTAALVPETDTSTLLPQLSTTPRSVEGNKNSLAETFISLIRQIEQGQTEFESLQKTIQQTREDWEKEQQNHDQELLNLSHQEEIDRKRNQEAYEYQISRDHKKIEDDFLDKKNAWERNLRDQQEQIGAEHQELDELRKLVANFDVEKSKAVKDAQQQLEKELTVHFEMEKKLKDQEQKAEKDLFTLRITTLSNEVSKQTTEINALKKALEETTQQVKEVAIKVIEAHNQGSKVTSPSEQP